MLSRCDRFLERSQKPVSNATSCPASTRPTFSSFPKRTGTLSSASGFVLLWFAHFTPLQWWTALRTHPPWCSSLCSVLWTPSPFQICGRHQRVIDQEFWNCLRCLHGVVVWSNEPLLVAAVGSWRVGQDMHHVLVLKSCHYFKVPSLSYYKSNMSLPEEKQHKN